jgi:hypothetical protein
MEIKYEDDFLSQEEYNEVVNYCLNAKYSYGESDDINLPVTGMISNVESSEIIYTLLQKRLHEKCPFLNSMKLYRFYINCFSPNELPYFHTDGEGLTFLFYINIDDQWSIQEGGETQFYLDNNIYGILPLPNRLVMFDGMIPHRAMSFRNNHRFTIAIKYQS